MFPWIAMSAIWSRKRNLLTHEKQWTILLSHFGENRLVRFKIFEIEKREMIFKKMDLPTR